MKGLRASILEDKEIGNCSAGGISSRCRSVTVVEVDGKPVPQALQISEAAEDAPAVRIVRRWAGTPNEYLHAEPVEEGPADSVSYMSGGTFIYSIDSRFRQMISPYPVSLHDRSESREQYASLSR